MNFGCLPCLLDSTSLPVTMGLLHSEQVTNNSVFEDGLGFPNTVLTAKHCCVVNVSIMQTDPKW